MCLQIYNYFSFLKTANTIFFPVDVRKDWHGLPIAPANPTNKPHQQQHIYANRHPRKIKPCGPQKRLWSPSHSTHWHARDCAPCAESLRPRHVLFRHRSLLHRQRGQAWRSPPRPSPQVYHQHQDRCHHRRRLLARP